MTHDNFWLFMKVIIYAILVKLFKRTVTQIYFSNFDSYYELKIVSLRGTHRIKTFVKKTT